MNTILTIFRKELLDILRDRRTLITMIVVPLLLMPVIMTVITSVVSSKIEGDKEKKLRIAVEHNNNGSDFVKKLKINKNLSIYEDIDPVQYNSLIRDDSIDLALVITEDFDQTVAAGGTAKMDVFYNSTNEGVLSGRLENLIDNYSDIILQTRLDSLNATTATITPIKTNKIDVYTTSESIGKRIGAFLPYIFVLFCLMGAMYPAIDLFTGEKERSTIETILTSPASRLQILLGKMMVVVLSGATSGLLTILGLYIAIKINPEVPDEFMGAIAQILNPTAVGIIVLMLIPLTIFFSGILIPVSIYAKSFKEAQTLIQPMMFLVIIPLAIVGVLPSIELNFLTALIPIFNIALASREVIAGTIDYGLLAVVFASLIAFAGLGILFCVKWFSHEGNILRT